LGVGLCCYFLAPWLEKVWPLVFDEKDRRGRTREALNRAEKQVRRLNPPLAEEQVSKTSDEKTYFPPKTQAARIEERLKAMRDRPASPPAPSAAPRSKGSKRAPSDFTQIRVLEQIKSADKRLRGSVVTRIALNRS